MTTRRRNLTAAETIETAARLTRLRGLEGWSIRDLGAELNVAPSAIYHHVGGKDLLSGNVVRYAIGEIALPSEDTWQGWFRALLGTLIPRAIAYPGSAKWLILHGPLFPTAGAVIDTGMGMLEGAGFGAGTSVAYTGLFNQPLSAIALSDERMQHAEDGPRDHATLVSSFARDLKDSPYAQRLITDMVGGIQSEQDRRAFAETYALFTLDVTIRGLQAQLTQP